MNTPMQFLGRSRNAEDTRKDSGIVVAYPNRSFADQKALTLLNKLRQHLPNADYREALPAQIVNCCTEMRRRGSFEQTERLEMTGTFALDDQSIRFRVLSLSPKQPSDAAPVLVLLDLISE